MQIKIMETGEVISLAEFYERNPRVQLPQPPTEEALAEFGAELVHEPESEPVPASCSRRQGRLALLALGLLDDAEAMIAGIADETERRAAQIEYEADTWERSSPFVQQLWGQFGGSSESLDDAFRLAVTL